jgi:hypothetical protein
MMMDFFGGTEPLASGAVYPCIMYLLIGVVGAGLGWYCVYALRMAANAQRLAMCIVPFLEEYARRCGAAAVDEQQAAELLSRFALPPEWIDSAWEEFPSMVAYEVFAFPVHVAVARYRVHCVNDASAAADVAAAQALRRQEIAGLGFRASCLAAQIRASLALALPEGGAEAVQRHRAAQSGCNLQRAE